LNRFVLAGLIEIPIHDTPKIRAIFDILDPRTVPIAIASVPFNTDEMPTNISGAEVPSATIVNPIVSSLRPNFFAINEALSTNLSAPQTRTAKATNKPKRL